MTDIEYIAENLSDEDILCQIAEEAAELAQAALKLRRAMADAKNPTPASYDEAYDNLLEEIADVKVAVRAFTLRDIDDDIEMIAREKAERWAGRLRARGENDT